MIAAMLINKNFNSIVIELFVRGRKVNISFIFITQSYLQKDVRLNTKLFLLWKFQVKEPQHIAFNHPSDTDFKDFMNLYKNVLQNHILL